MNACPECRFQPYEDYGTLVTCIHFVAIRKRIKERGHLPPVSVIECEYAPVALSEVQSRANHRH